MSTTVINFAIDNHINDDVNLYLQEQDIIFNKAGIQKLQDHWMKCGNLKY